MQKINLKPFTERLTWQDIEQYAPLHWTRLFAYTFELLMVCGIGYAVVVYDYSAPLLAMMLTVMAIGVWMFMFRFLHNRRLHHYKVRAKKFAAANNFTYKEKADWSGTAKTLPFRADRQPSTVGDKYVVSGTYAGHRFRSGLYEIVYGGGESQSTYRRTFLRLEVKRSTTLKPLEIPDVVQASRVHVEHKGKYLYIYSADCNMKTMAASMPILFDVAAAYNNI